MREERKAEYEKRKEFTIEQEKETETNHEVPQTILHTSSHATTQQIPHDTMSSFEKESVEENVLKNKNVTPLRDIHFDIAPKDINRDINSLSSVPLHSSKRSQPPTKTSTPFFLKIPARLLLVGTLLVSAFYVGGYQEELTQTYLSTKEKTHTAFITTMEYSKDSFFTLKDKTKNITTQLAIAPYTTVTNTYATSYASVHSAVTILPQKITTFITDSYHRIIYFFSKDTDLIVVATFNDKRDDNNESFSSTTTIQLSVDQPLTEDIQSFPLETSQPSTSQPATSQPIMQRTIERIVIQSGITEQDVNTKLEQLNNKLSAEIYSLSSINAGNIVNNYNVIAQTNRIDNLKRVTITSSIFTDGTISGSTSFSGTTGAFSGSLSGASLSISGDTTLSGSLTLGSGLEINSSGFVYNSTTGNVGIGTSTPYAKLSVVGPVVGEYFYATSTTATSTFDGGLLVTRAPTIAHTFSSWATGASNSAFFDAPLVINPASAVGDSNLISAAVGGSVMFLVDAEGDVFVNNLTSVGDVTLAETTASTFIVEGNTTLGDSITDTTTINGTLTVTGQTSIATIGGNFGVGTTSPWARLSVAGSSTDSTTPLFTISTSTASATSTVVHIDASGKFGIGTTSPSEQFAVANLIYIGGIGTSTIENNLYVGGAVEIGSVCINCGGDGSFSGGALTATGLTVTGNSTLGDDSSDTTTFNGIATFIDGFISQASSTLSALLNGVNGIFTSYLDASHFVATSTTATSTFAGGLAVNTSGLVYDFSTNRVGIGTTSPYAKLSVVGEVVAAYFTATTTATSTLPLLSATTAFSLGSDYFTSFTGTGLSTTDGVLSTTLGTSVDLTAEITGTLSVDSGGTGWANIQAGGLLYGNGTSALSTTTQGTGGQILAWLSGIPTWSATTTFSGGLTYSGGNVIADLGTDITASEMADGDHGDFTYLSNVATLDTNSVADNEIDYASVTFDVANTVTAPNFVADTTATSTFAGSLASSAGDLLLSGLGIANNVILSPYGGNVGIGTTSPTRRLSVTDAVSTAQFILSYDDTMYADFLIDSVGDLTIDIQGSDIRFNNENLWVCSSGACPTGTPVGTGNLIIETALGIGSSSPYTMLDVAGSVAITGIIDIQSTSATSTFGHGISISGVGGISFPDGTFQNTAASSGGVDNIIRTNIIINAFRLAVNGGLSVQNMVDGVVDEFEDDTGIDDPGSTNEFYDSTDDFYDNYTSLTVSAAAEWAGGTGDYTFPGDDIEVSVNDNFIYTNDDLPGDFEITFTHKEDEVDISYIGVFESSNKGSVNPNGGNASIFGWFWQNHTAQDHLTDYEGITTGSTLDYDMAGVADGAIIKFKRVGSTLSVQVDGTTVHTFATASSATLSFFVAQAKGNDGHILDVSWWFKNATANNMTLLSEATTALAQPTDAFIVLWEEDVDSVTLNTDLKAWVSRDGGTSYYQATLSEVASLSTGRILTGTATFGAETGTSIKYKIETLNTKKQRIHGIGLEWR